MPSQNRIYQTGSSNSNKNIKIQDFFFFFFFQKCPADYTGLRQKKKSFFSSATGMCLHRPLQEKDHPEIKNIAGIGLASYDKWLFYTTGVWWIPQKHLSCIYPDKFHLILTINLQFNSALFTQWGATGHF